MSIEDINYLYKNSIKDNAIIFVDSSKRDKSIFPNPNKYNITFSNPFKLVYGLEVIEASIPRTMYQIDKYNNNFKIIIIHFINYCYFNSIFHLIYSVIVFLILVFVHNAAIVMLFFASSEYSSYELCRMILRN